MAELTNRLRAAAMALKGAVTFDHSHLFMTGQQLTQKAMRTDSAYANSWVAFSCIKRLGTDAAGIPLRVLSDPEKPDSIVKPSHALAALIKSPSRSFSQAEFIQWIVTWLNLRGEFFISFDDPVRPTEFIFWTDPAAWREVMHNDRVAGWRYQKGAVSENHAAINVIHHRFVNPANPWRGQAPIAAAAIPYSIDVNTGVLQNDIVSRGGERAPIFTAAADMTGPQRQSAVDVLRSRTGANDGTQPRPVLLPSGITVVDPRFISADLSILDKQESQPDRICAVFGMSKSLLGFEDIDKYATFQGRLKVYFTQTLIPMLRGIEATFDAFFNRNMPSAYRGYVRFDLDAVSALAESVADKFQAAVVAHNGGLPWTVCNERFGLGLDLDMVPGADRILVSSTLAPIDSILAEWDTPQEPEAPATAPAVPVAGNAPNDPAIQDTALNGAQVSSMLELAMAVADGSLPIETAAYIMVRAFQMTYAEALALLRPASDMPKPDPAADPAPAADPDDKPVPPPSSADTPAKATQAGSSMTAAVRLSSAKRAQAMMSRARDTRGRLQRQQRLFRAESSMRRDWKAVVGTTMKRTLAAMNDVTDEQGARSAVEQGFKDFNSKLVAVAAKYHDIAVREGMRSIVEIVSGKMDDSALHVWKKTAPWKPAVTSAIKGRTKYIDDMSKALFKDVTQMAVDSVREGIGYGEIANALTERFNLGRCGFGRAETIARTEVGSAYNVARFVEMKSNGFNAHMWLTADDELVRGSDGKGDFDHSICHEEVVKLDEEFLCGLLYPMQDGGDAGNVINCRCETIPVELDEGEAQ